MATNITETQDAAAFTANEQKQTRSDDSMRDTTTRTNASNTTHITASSITDSVADSPMFKLSAELRNAIYRYALVTEEAVLITKANGIPEPALLLACKIIRSEATGIFYSENSLVCKVVNFDCSALRLIAREHGYGPSRTGSGIMRDDNDQRIWKNLVFWLRMLHRNLCCGLNGIAVGFEADPEECMIAALFALVYESRASGRTWEVLERQIQYLRPTMIALNSDWAKD